MVKEYNSTKYMSSRTVLEMSALEARSYFKKSSSYVNFEVPSYISFDNLITLSSSLVAGKQLADICNRNERDRPTYPSDFDGVNYTILSNKDGAYSWRPLQIIHPVLYVDFVNMLTEDNAWLELLTKFEEYRNSYVECISIPRESQDKDSDKAWQVSTWWEAIEQETIKQSLRFNYLAMTDITDCYGSIYTHSFEWALDEDGREGAKRRRKNREDSNGIGSRIDSKLQNLNSAQTNGIPQGSTLMDFLAEIILGYADLLLTEKIKATRISQKDFRILRYRDDYRILANSPVVGNAILKQIDVVLSELGLKMSPSKTKTSSDIITSAIKEEKMDSIYTAPGYQYFQKRALRIYQLSKKYPNSGLVSKELGAFYDDFTKPKKVKHVNNEVLLAIFVMIAVNSPKTIYLVAAIASKILERIDDIPRAKTLVKDMIKKFDDIPNSGLIDIWLQRISAPLGLRHDYSDLFTKVAVGTEDIASLWNNEWLNEDGVLYINNADISKLEKQINEESITYVVQRKEFELYRIADYL